jgi:molybdenum cofactor guanylyltransferase
MNGDVSLAILAGGQGLRLGGVSKGLLRLEGQTFLERLLSLRPHFQETFIIANEPAAYAPCDVPIHPDAWPGRGAPGGVCTALIRAQTPWVLAVGCDMPFVKWETILLLLARRRDAEVVAFEEGGRLQPFPALYQTKLSDSWARHLPENPSLRMLMAQARCARVTEEEWRPLDPRGLAWTSINTVNDLQVHRVELPKSES